MDPPRPSLSSSPLYTVRSIGAGRCPTPVVLSASEHIIADFRRDVARFIAGRRRRRLRPHPGPPGRGVAMKAGRERGCRDLVRDVLRAERGLKGYVPTPRPDGPPEPKNADETLAALAAKYRPGDAIGLQQMIDAIAITWEHAKAVRRWAEHNGAWPYLRPGPCRPAGHSDPAPPRRRRKDGSP